MDTATKPIAELHAENTEWIKKLDFYADEIKVMTNRISEIAAKNTAADVMGQVEHFQNQFIIQKNHIDELRHAVNDHETYIVNRIKENPVASDHRKLNDHPVLRDRMNAFEKIFSELRSELNKFLSKTL